MSSMRYVGKTESLLIRGRGRKGLCILWIAGLLVHGASKGQARNDDGAATLIMLVRNYLETLKSAFVEHNYIIDVNLEDHH